MERLTQATVPPSTGPQTVSVSEKTSYLTRIVANLNVGSACRRRVLNSCALLTGAAIYVGTWFLDDSNSNLLASLTRLLFSLLGSYVLIGFAIVIVGNIATSPKFRIFNPVDDGVMKEDIDDLLDQLISVLVPITISVISIVALALALLAHRF